MHRFQIFSPAYELRDFVKNYFVTRVSDAGDLPSTTIIYPMNIPALNFLSRQGIYQYADSDGYTVQASSITMVGQLSRMRKVEFIQPGLIVSVIFTPCGMHRLFGIHMMDITDHAINPGGLTGMNYLEECREHIFNENSLGTTLDRLNNYLIRWARKRESDHLVIDEMASLINQLKGNVNIDWLVTEANMSIKTFERQFMEKIGLMPKLFSRIVRYAHAAKLLHNQVDIFSIIRDCGYADQAHLIKEFRSFFGHTPKIYLNEHEEARFFFKHLVRD